ncbi:putative serine/threonine-protein kinase [Senna tora]|uniref:Putative serine/threonine-protein kinase n=1 Tax=Senna tora TaxID=362788 RepID=A0A834WQG9_9FABA|nr:putative serine/threonine-protein kinase [Senna tora]
MKQNGYREEQSCCYFHPKQVVIGICPLCLNERLLILAAKQGLNPSLSSNSKPSTKLQNCTHTKPHTYIHKIFALFSRPDSHHCKSHYDHSSPSPEESFISIKFEENGVGSWEKNKVGSLDAEAETTKSVIEHGKSREGLRWRKRIGHIFHLMRWKRPTKTKGNNVNVVVELEGVKKVRKGWMRPTKRRTME